MAELLAPAGSLDNVLTAIDAGADAVYFGGKSFNARRFAHNLDDEEIVRAVRTAHLFGVKVYVTVNILMADTELDDLTIYLKSLDKAGVDGIIVQDMAVALLARRVVPDLPLHGSTQMTVADSDGVRFLEENGFTQAVLSRELSLADIQSVCASSPLAIEVFIHGASCMAYSGQCLMSSFLGGRSGNRGACAQPCRQPYTLVRDGKAVMKQEAYVLSLKDLKGLDYIDDLLDAGVTSFKIEGRMKGDTYVRTVVTAYRKVIDAHNSSPKARKEAHDEAAALLTSAFNRSYQDDFLRGMVQRRTLTEKNPSGRQTASDAAVGLTRKIPIYAHVDVDGDGRLELTLWDEKAHTVVVAADFLPQPASKRPATIDYLKKQLGRLGETPFALAEVTAWDETKMIPASVLNDLRRQAADALTEVILADYHRPAAGTVMPISETVVEVKKARSWNSSSAAIPSTVLRQRPKREQTSLSSAANRTTIVLSSRRIGRQPSRQLMIPVRPYGPERRASFVKPIERPYKANSNGLLHPASTAFTSAPWLSLRWLKRSAAAFLSEETGLLISSTVRLPQPMRPSAAAVSRRLLKRRCDRSVTWPARVLVLLKPSLKAV